MRKKRIALFLGGIGVCAVVIILAVYSIAMYFTPLDYLVDFPFSDSSVRGASGGTICVPGGEIQDIPLCQAPDDMRYYVGFLYFPGRVPRGGEESMHVVCPPPTIRLYVREYAFAWLGDWWNTDIDMWRGDASDLSDAAMPASAEFDSHSNRRFIGVEVNNRVCSHEFCFDVSCVPSPENDR